MRRARILGLAVVLGCALGILTSRNLAVAEEAAVGRTTSRVIELPDGVVLRCSGYEGRYVSSEGCWRTRPTVAGSGTPLPPVEIDIDPALETAWDDAYVYLARWAKLERKGETGRLPRDLRGPLGDLTITRDAVTFGTATLPLAERGVYEAVWQLVREHHLGSAIPSGDN